MVLACLVFLASLAGGGAWKTLAPGMELRELKPSSTATAHPIVVLRMDPTRWELALVGRGSAREEASHTARDWAHRHRLSAAINAGMFAADGTTHLGYMECEGRVTSKSINAYRSVAAFSPKVPHQPAFRLFDLKDRSALPPLRSRYACLVQNLRLVQRPGLNRWEQQPKRWSEAALGEDRKGRILFLFSRSPFSMHDLIEELLASDLGLVAAQHLEGGPQAQLYVHVNGFEREMFGSFAEGDWNAAAWPVPHVLGVRPRAAPD